MTEKRTLKWVNGKLNVSLRQTLIKLNNNNIFKFILGVQVQFDRQSWPWPKLFAGIEQPLAQSKGRNKTKFTTYGPQKPRQGLSFSLSFSLSDWHFNCYFGCGPLVQVYEKKVQTPRRILGRERKAEKSVPLSGPSVILCFVCLKVWPSCLWHLSMRKWIWRAPLWHERKLGWVTYPSIWGRWWWWWGFQWRWWVGPGRIPICWTCGPSFQDQKLRTAHGGSFFVEPGLVILEVWKIEKTQRDTRGNTLLTGMFLEVPVSTVELWTNQVMKCQVKFVGE